MIENLKNKTAVILSTWFGVGLIPFAPGTFGSFFALPFAFAILKYSNWLFLLGAAVLIFFIGIKTASIYEKILAKKDPKQVVIDEVLGQWLALLPASLDPLSFAIGFALFRFFDISKIWPASWADKELGGGLGIMLDDLIAGVYSAAILFSLKYFAVI
ncbi:MAG: phosphatidylglycerophosphatase A [Alphaproteobacteria bacterium]